MELPLDIGSMTLAQAKEYCIKQRECFKGNDAICSDSCRLWERNICQRAPIKWKLDRNIPRLTPDELDICRTLGGDSLKRIGESSFVNVYRKTSEDGVSQLVSQVICGMFPSVEPGDCINVEELLKGE